MTLQEAEVAARQTVNKTCGFNAAIAWIPFSTVALTFSEGLLVRRIGRIFEVTVDEQDISSVVAAAVGATLGHAAGESAKIAGLVVLHPVIAAGLAKAIGEAAVVYFKERSPLCHFQHYLA